MGHKTNNRWLYQILSCPLCHESISLTDDGKSVHCANRHNFDLSDKGYLSLLTGDTDSAKWDTADMVERRARFHENDNYQELKSRLRELLAEYKLQQAGELTGATTNAAPRLLDIGSGPGYYALLAAQLGYQTVASDLSRRALAHAVKLHPHIEGLACDVWSGIPLKDNSFDVILSIFAPKNPLEFKRVLKTGGILIVVVPNKDHYAEMRKKFPLLKVGRRGKTKEDEVRERIEPHLSLISNEHIGGKTLLDERYIEDLIMMGPNAYHTNLEELQAQLSTLPEPFIDEASITLSVYLNE